MNIVLIVKILLVIEKEKGAFITVALIIRI